MRGECPYDQTGEQPHEGDGAVDIDIGKVSPKTGEKSTDTMLASDDSGESNGNNSENSESKSDDGTENAEAGTNSSDTAGSTSETKADKPEAPTNSGDDELAGILDRWDQSNKEIADMLEKARKDIEANVLRMSDQKTNLEADLKQQIADLEEGIANENDRLEKIKTNLSKLSDDKDNQI